jgi:YD repeat-containing protein
LKVKCSRFINSFLCLFIVLALATPALAQQPITFQYFYDDRGQLVKVVDSTGKVVEYVYDEVGNILEVQRYTVTGLAIFNFTPQQGAVGDVVIIQGQVFSPTPAENTVTFNGVTAIVTAATTTSLSVTVPQGATTGPISVTVAGQTATSGNDFIISQAPIITSISPALVLAGTVVSDTQVTGYNLTGSTFSFSPVFTPTVITVTSAVIGPSGLTATLTVDVASNAAGTFALVVSNLEGSSNPFPSPANTLNILDAAGDFDQDFLNNGDELLYGTDPFNPDSDGDSYLDGIEVTAGSDPLDPASTPYTLGLPGEAVGPVFSVLNLSNPAGPGLPGEAVGPVFSVLNLSNPAGSGLPGEAVGPVFSVLNLSNPAGSGLPGEAGGPPFSVENETGP